MILCGPYAMGDDFTFSFTNLTGNVSGTVTGEILGLTDNATSAAAHVIIESYPPDLFNGYNASLPSSMDATQWSWPMTNLFTEVGGKITAGGFSAENTSAGGIALLEIDGPGGSNELILDADQGSLMAGSGLGYVTFQPLRATVPEPSTSGLALIALGLLGLIRRRTVPEFR